MRTGIVEGENTFEGAHRLASSWQPMLDERITQLQRIRDQLDSCIGCGCLSLDSCGLYNPNDRAASLGPGPRCLLGDTPAENDNGVDVVGRPPRSINQTMR